LAIDQLQSRKGAETLETLEAMERFLPESILPITNERVYLQLGLLYQSL